MIQCIFLVLVADTIDKIFLQVFVDHRESSESHQRVIRESSGSHQRVIRESSESHQRVIRESSESHQRVIRESLESHQRVIKESSESHPYAPPKCRAPKHLGYSISLRFLKTWFHFSLYKLNRSKISGNCFHISLRFLEFAFHLSKISGTCFHLLSSL